MLSDYRDFLFASAAHQVRARSTTPEYLLEQADRFAEHFEAWQRENGEPGDEGLIAGVLYARAFTDGFKPGMMLRPEDAVRAVTDQLEGVLSLRERAQAGLVRQRESTEQTVAAGADKEARAEAARLAREQREREIAEAEAARKAADEQLLNPQTVGATPVGTLPIASLAKAAYTKAGLLTVSDLETYAKVQPLEAVKGVGEQWAKDTLAEIAKLYEAEKAKQTNSDSAQEQNAGA